VRQTPSRRRTGAPPADGPARRLAAPPHPNLPPDAGPGPRAAGSRAGTGCAPGRRRRGATPCRRTARASSWTPRPPPSPSHTHTHAHTRTPFHRAARDRDPQWESGPHRNRPPERRHRASFRPRDSAAPQHRSRSPLYHPHARYCYAWTRTQPPGHVRLLRLELLESCPLHAAGTNSTRCCKRRHTHAVPTYAAATVAARPNDPQPTRPLPGPLPDQQVGVSDDTVRCACACVRARVTRCAQGRGGTSGYDTQPGLWALEDGQARIFKENNKVRHAHRTHTPHTRPQTHGPGVRMSVCQGATVPLSLALVVLPPPSARR
jgi:hypothetical protein